MTFKLNTERTVAVSTESEYNDDMGECPRGVKCILLGKGGVATIAEYHGEEFWVEWAPLPRRPIKPQPPQTSSSGQPLQ